jgi:hypothetical protein
VTVPEPDNDWDKPWVFREMMKRAQQRCANVGESERLLGYTENCQVYRDMAGEFKNLDMWVMQQAYAFPHVA